MAYQEEITSGALYTLLYCIMLEENKGVFNTPFAAPRLLGQLKIWGNYAKEQPSDCF